MGTLKKREIINFETINKDNYTIIPAKDIEESRVRIAAEMSKIKRKIKPPTKKIHKLSPDVVIDWGNLQSVKDYYNSFERWSSYISGGCKYDVGVGEIKDGILFHNDIHYLPAGGTALDWCEKSKIIEDGWYYVRLFKKGYGYYRTMPTTNHFYVYQTEHNHTFTKEEIDHIEYRNKYVFKSTYDKIHPDDITHIKSLNLSKINSKELDFIKSNMKALFSDVLPFKAKNKVYINTWESFKQPLVCTKGLLYVDNGYHGHNINKMDYIPTLKYHPSFTNQAQYYCSTYITSFSAESLEQIAIEIEKSIKDFSKID